MGEEDLPIISRGVAYIFSCQKDREEFVKIAKKQKDIIVSRRWGKRGLMDHIAVYKDNLCYYTDSIGMLHWNHVDIVREGGMEILTFKI